MWIVGAIAPAQLDGLEMLDAAGCSVTTLVLSASTQFLADLLPAAWFDEETAAELDDPLTCTASGRTRCSRRGGS